MTDLHDNRIGTIARLAEKAPPNFGRTALMKFCYFLQSLRGVPLSYRFTLYSYGPFDSDVLQQFNFWCRPSGHGFSRAVNAVESYGFSR